MTGELLLDTGPWFPCWIATQSFHEECRRFFDSWTRPVVSTEAVLTETTHLLSRVRGGAQACLDFFLAGGAVLVPAAASSLRRTRELMEKYRVLPMDYADASLVVLAGELDTNRVFTTGREFGIYRINSRRRFRIYP